MKLTKKVLSIALALIMIIGCLAISVSADYFSDLESDKYDNNIAISYDQYIRDYSYGTGISAHCPYQVTFNEDGWMRAQSQTEAQEAAYLEAKAAGDTAAMEANEGQYEHQWQLLFKPTPEYQAQFKNAMLNAYNNDCIFAFYTYIASAKLAKPDGTYNTSPTIDVSCDFLVKADTDGDGEYESDIHFGKDRNYTDTHKDYNFQYINSLFDMSELAEVIEMECDFKLVQILIQPQNYDFDKGSKNGKGQEGISLLDAYISPCYVDTLPGFASYSIYGTDAFNAPVELDPATFTIGDKTGKIKPEDWQWKGWTQTENEDNEPVFGELGDLLRDENGCPIMENGEAYIPIPIVKLSDEEAVDCSNLKAQVNGSSVTLTWDYTGTPKSFVLYEADGQYYKDSITSNTITLTDLKAGTYHFFVTGKNSEGVEGIESNEVEVKIDSTVIPTQPTEKPTSPTATQPTQPTNPIVTNPTTKATVATTTAKVTVKVPTLKLVSGKKQFKVNYKKVAGAAGFQIRYKIKGKWKTKTFKTTKNAVKVIKKLKKGTYSVQIRAFTKSKVYSNWSKTKKVKVK